jgi:hypothetical protein
MQNKLNAKAKEAGEFGKAGHIDVDAIKKA